MMCTLPRNRPIEGLPIQVISAEAEPYLTKKIFLYQYKKRAHEAD